MSYQCDECKNWFLADPKLCSTCGAHKLHDAELASALARAEAAEARLAEAIALLKQAMPIEGPAENYAAWDEWHNKRDAAILGEP